LTAAICRVSALPTFPERFGYTTLWRARQSRRNVEIAFKRLEKATDKAFEEFSPFFVENACNRRRDFL
jgi:hypothetical protein